MYKQLSYLEEVKVNKSKIIIFCIIISIITIILVVITGIIGYKLIKHNSNKSNDISLGAKTVGKSAEEIQGNVVEVKEEKTISQEEQQPQEQKKKSNFPSHDFNLAMQSQLPQYNDEIAKKVVNVYYEEAKKIYLTFDDGPSRLTGSILDILKQYNVKATFFVLGTNVVNNPTILKRAYDEGHFIASHGYTHKYSQIYSSPQAVLDEYNQSLAAIQNAIGIPNYNPHLFRFPGGSSGGPYNDIKQQAIELLKQNQITHTNWNCLTGDSAGVTTIEGMWEQIRQTSAGDDNLVILMHDAGDKNVTVQFLSQLIEYYLGQGYIFTNYYDVMTN